MSRRVLITGASGFAGGHLASACAAAGDEVVALSRSGSAVVAPSRPDPAHAGRRGDAVAAPPGSDPARAGRRSDAVAAPPASDRAHGSRRELVADLLDADAARAAVAAAAPDVVYHLAALAHVGRSWRDPGATLAHNQAMSLNVLEAVRVEAPDAVLVAVSSGEVYGPPASLPVDEGAPLRPQNPYAVSKAAGDLLAGFYADAHGLGVVRPRAFNHAGPGQPPIYALASFTRQVAAGLEAGDDPIRLVTGNPDSRRDFTDVRDVVRAYRLLAEAGRSGVFNVCSGRSVSPRELLGALAETAGAEIEHVVDSALVRAHEVMEIRGSAERLRAATGWEPKIPLETTLADTVTWWRAQIRAGRAGMPAHE